ncbi:MAG: Tm-1-like ATP-binding domain-containing protein [Phycisphaerae bacterium]|nr:Tm-1-like ATP-binding domain-containing protein [Phycisphaerae bacterium]
MTSSPVRTSRLPTVLLIGTLDTKGPECAHLAERVRAFGCNAVILDSGILGEPIGVRPDITREEVARAAGFDLAAIRATGARGPAVRRMLDGVRAVTLRLAAESKIDGLVALGGAEGSVLAAAPARALPLGFPKLIVTPIASGHRRFGPLVGTRDVTLMHSVVDILGLNSVSREIFDNAAAAIAGMATAYATRRTVQAAASHLEVAATMLGNTTRPLMRIRERLAAKGIELVLFHANGVGGEAMEEFVEAGRFAATLDYTVSELAAEVAGGFHRSGRERPRAAGERGIPQVLVPGCPDFAVFGAKAEVPESMRSRPIYEHNPEFTLVRLTRDEELEVARRLAARAGAAKGPVTMLLPLGGLSIPDAPGGAFRDEAISAAFFAELRRGVAGAPHVRVVDVEAHINDDAFADRTLEALASYLPALHGR